MSGRSGLLLREWRGVVCILGGGVGGKGGVICIYPGVLVFLVAIGVLLFCLLGWIFGTGVIGIYERSDLLETGLDSAYGGRS